MAGVLIIDDMALYRSVIARYVDGTEGLEVVGKAVDGDDGLAKIRDLRPDLVTLDLEMPGRSGLDVLRELHRSRCHPMPAIVVFSAQSSEGAAVTMEALRLGAASFVLKPTAARGAAAIQEDLIPLLQSLATATRPVRPAPVRPAPVRSSTVEPTAAAAGPSASVSAPAIQGSRRLLVIGSSTGGPPALERALGQLPADFPVPVLVVQHMPPVFTATMAANLDRRCALAVAEARDGEALVPGIVRIAPGDFHLRVEATEGGLHLRLDQGDRVYGLRPAVDCTLRSLKGSGIPPDRLVTAIFTGMGCDGLEGSRDLHRGGMRLLTQTEASCVVYGMPKAIDEAGMSSGHFTPEDFGAVISRIAWRW